MSIRVTSTQEEGVTKPCVHQFVNESTTENVSCVWVGYDSKEVEYHKLEPGHAIAQSTYNTHPWRLRGTNGRLIGEYCGHGSKLVVTVDGSFLTAPLEAPNSHVKPEWGQYRDRAEVMGLTVQAYDCVGEDAVEAACRLIKKMLNDCPQSVLDRLSSAGARVGIIGRHQLTTDIPEHSYMKMTKGGRDLDGTARGLGGTKQLPLTTCGEENLTMVDDRHYPMENILIHELGHTVMNVGLNDEEQQAIHNCYVKARDNSMYTSGIYMISNADEYWAEGCQSWFEATIRTDVNDGHNTREKLQLHDPALALCLSKAFGEGEWRFVSDSPKPLRFRGNVAKRVTLGQETPGSFNELEQGDASCSSRNSNVREKEALSTSVSNCSPGQDQQVDQGSALVSGALLEAPEDLEMDRARLVSTGQHSFTPCCCFGPSPSPYNGLSTSSHCQPMFFCCQPVQTTSTSKTFIFQCNNRNSCIQSTSAFSAASLLLGLQSMLRQQAASSVKRL
ncbi:hypothetical protein CEUSTIGMA_g8007.t1 [Chlamydomonas eustigma]|uniref:Uncharacterized protein n=1 Tax=Chlamydomonas eustigma TaxID=1157962 RepID=A0A250XCT5_9CHLO|nr:hypothetical protein CEUSTIGMA_g8007.t1 [Chlamydomonas eustigma]|eukprot:GAX80570.1 hypothetical protein CEUSTIGMA_g8007.t1 [Chlamydomonas eustigma]